VLGHFPGTLRGPLADLLHQPLIPLGQPLGQALCGTRRGRGPGVGALPRTTPEARISSWRGCPR